MAAMNWLQGYVDLSNAIATLGANLLVQTTLVIGSGLFAAWLCHRRGAAVRSTVLRVTLAASLLCPVTSWMLSTLGVPGFRVVLPQASMLVAEAEPQLAQISADGRASALNDLSNDSVPKAINDPLWRRSDVAPFNGRSFPGEVLPPMAQSQVPNDTALEVIQEAKPPDEVVTAAAALTRRPSVLAVVYAGLAGVWLVAACMLIARLAIANLLMWRIRRRARPASAELASECGTIARILNIAAPPVLVGSRISSPCLVGWWRPVILLPEKLKTISGDALAHELAHLLRRDCLWNLISRLSVAAFALQPLLWVLARRMEDAADEVCDDFVVTQSHDRASYARELVDIAERFQPDWSVATAGVGIAAFKSSLGKRVLRILDTSRDLSIKTGIAALVVIVACGVVGATVAGLIGASGNSRIDADKNVVEQGQKEGDGGEAFRDSSLNSEPVESDNLTVQGRVLGPDGKPLEGAKLYVLSLSPDNRSVRATTGPDGRFQFAFAKTEFWTLGRDESWRFAKVLAVAEGYGPKWVEAGMIDRGELTLQLVKDQVPIQGRVVDFEGRPVSGATVRVHSIVATPDEDLSPILKNPRLTEWPPEGWICGLPNAVTTDKDGRFQLTGVGRERVVLLDIEGPSIERSGVRVLTRVGIDDKALNRAVQEEESAQTAERPIYGSTFEHVVGPPKSIVGTVREQGTGKPLAGIPVFLVSARKGWSPIGAVTDEHGQYRLLGGPKAKQHTVNARPNFRTGPSAFRPYLDVLKQVNDTVGLEPLTVDFELWRGVTIEGGLVDALTHKPVANATIRYLSLERRPDVTELNDGFYTANTGTDEKGAYKIPGVPGQGILLVEVGSGEYPPARLDPADKAKGYGDMEDFVLGQPLYDSCAYRVIETLESDESVTCNLALDPARTRKGIVLGPDGQPLEGASVSGLTSLVLIGRSKTLDSHTFTAIALDPERPRGLVFLHKDRKLAGQVSVRGDEPEPLAVRLEPWGTVIGRVLDSDAESLAGAHVKLWNVPTAYGVMYPADRPSDETITTGTDGRFRIEGIVPGLKYGIEISKQGLPSKTTMWVNDLSIQGGETKDLGDITVERSTSANREQSNVEQPVPDRTPLEELKEHIAWGNPAENGLQAGVVLDPWKDSYKVGEVVRCRFFFRNAGNERLTPGLPAVLEARLCKPHVVDEQGNPIATATKSREERLVPGILFSLNAGGMGELPAPELFLAIGEGTEDDAMTTVVKAKAGKTCRAYFTLWNYAAKEGELDTGRIQFAVAAPRTDGVATSEVGQREAQQTVEVRGRVVGPRGEPVLNASLHVGQPFAKELQVVAASDSRGNFIWPLGRSKLNEALTANPKLTVRLAASADGYGFGWIDIAGADWAELARREFTLRLVEDLPIQGRVMTADGQPAVGAEVYVNNIRQPTKPTLDEYLGAVRNEGKGFWSFRDNDWRGGVPGEQFATTNENGRFTLKGIGAERIALLSLHGEHIHNWWVEVVTRRPSGDAGDAGVLHLAEPPYNSHYFASFTHITAPSRTLRGVVRDQKTGDPVAGVRVFADFHTSVEATTQADGRFELAGSRKSGQYKVNAFAKEARFFRKEVYVDDTAGLDPIEFTIELPQGITTRGRVTDKATGRPIQGTVEYYALFPNQHISRLGGDAASPCSAAPIQADGSYELQVLPGPGVLGVRNYDQQYGFPKFDLKRVKELLDGADIPTNSDEFLGTAAGGQAMGAIGHIMFKAVEYIKPAEDTESLTQDFLASSLEPDLKSGGQKAELRVETANTSAEDGLNQNATQPAARNGKVAADTQQPRATSSETQKAITTRGHVVGPNGKAVAGVAIVMSGRVLGPDGKPLGGVRVLGTFPSPDFPSAEATTDKNGAFVFHGNRDAFQKAVAEHSRSQAQIVAHAEGFASDWRVLTMAELTDAELNFRLYEKVRIEGRIVSSEGQPLVGIEILVKELRKPTGGLDEYIRAARDGSLTWASTQDRWEDGNKKVQTDADGRFRLSDFGAERLVTLSLNGDGVPGESVVVMTRNPPADSQTGALSTKPSIAFGLYKLYYSTFTHVAPPNRSMRGIVRDRLTGQPVADVRLSCSGTRNQVTTGRDGRFELPGCVKQSTYLVTAVADGQPYFNRRLSVADSPGLQPIECEIEMLRGVTVRGKVTDGQSVAQGIVEYHVLYPNSFADRLGDHIHNPCARATIKPDGTYEIQALPGPGVLTVATRPGQEKVGYLTPIVDIKKLRDVIGEMKMPAHTSESLSIHGGGQNFFAMSVLGYQSLELISPAENDREIRIDHAVTRGKTLEGIVVGHDGSPATGVRATGLLRSAHFLEPIAGNRFAIQGVGRGRPRDVFFYDESKHQGARLRITGDEEPGKPIQVQLQPCGSLQGRLIDHDGAPIADAMLVLNLDFHIGPRTWSARTDENGKFLIKGLIPRAVYNGAVASDFVLQEVVVESSEVKEIGDVQVGG